MIIRLSGGNNGIAEYLENGRKAEREFTRDQLDHRLILDGNLEATNTIIQSIDDKGQERYRHITLSFHESEISHDTLKAITEDYKNILMNAYHQDEYTFYAEAHLPKIKNIQNNATGELVERKPHIHIVIPGVNLVTGNKLLPTGKVTITERYLDSIQEHINYKYNLKSPKDAARVSDDNYANVLSRTKGDMFRERNSEFKKEIYNGLTSNNITSFSDFGHYLEGFGDVKLKNQDKENSYFAVKFEGDSKFTNLKNPLFSRQYVEKRNLQMIKPTEKQVLSLVTEWQDKVSHEVKHIFPKSSVVRNAYNALNDEDKKQYLKKRIEDYDQQNKLSGSRGRQGDTQRGTKQYSRPSAARRSNRLSYMPERSLVYGIRGGTRPTGEQERSGEVSERVLSPDEHRNLGESGPESLYADKAVRRDNAGERPEFTRGIKTIQESSVLHDEYWQHLNEKAQADEIHTMREIRDNIDPLRLLAGLQRQYQANPYDYKISQANDGSPRFKVGNRNMNASDFLTKHFNLSWKDSKEFLLKTYAEQQTNTPFDKPVIRKTLTKNEANERYYSLKETQKELKNIIREQRSSLYNELKDLRSQIYQVKGTEREVARGVIIYHKLTGLEMLSEIDSKGREFLNDYHNIWNEDKDPMKALQKLREFIKQDEDESSIEAAETTLSIKDRVSSQQRIQELQKTRLKDLVLQKSPEKLVFLNPESEKPVFTDKGVRVIASKDATNEEVALILEYSKEKFGGVLKLNGNDEFKTQCALVAAEKGMNIILKPDEFNQLMKQHKADLVANQIQQDTLEQTAPEQSIENATLPPQTQTNQAEPAAQSVEQVKALLADQGLRRIAMSDEQKQREFSASPDMENEVRAQINSEIIEARTGVLIEPAALVQDVIDARHATLSPQTQTNQAEPAAQSVEQVKALLADQGLRRIAMSDEQKQREFSASPDMENEVRAQINSEIIEARTGVLIEPAALVQDVIDAHNATLPQQTTQALQEQVTEVTEIFVVGDTDNGAVFHSREEADDYYQRQKESAIKDLESLETTKDGMFVAETIDHNGAIKLISVEIATSKLDQYPDKQWKDLTDEPQKLIADAVKEYAELNSKASISDLIADYAQKAESENLEFFVRDVTEEIESAGMTFNEAEQHLEKELNVMRSVKQDMQQDDNEQTM